MMPLPVPLRIVPSNVSRLASAPSKNTTGSQKRNQKVSQIFTPQVCPDIPKLSSVEKPAVR